MGVVGVAAGAAVLAWAVALSVVDLRERRLPNVLTLSGAAVITAGAAVAGRGAAALLGGLALAALYLVVHLAAPSGLGAGYVKLALALGALTGALGVGAWTLAALGAPLLTALAGVAAVVRGRGSALPYGRGAAVPHGPAMCAASLAAAAVVLL